MRLDVRDCLPGAVRALCRSISRRMVGAARGSNPGITYAVGDVHGRSAALTALLGMIADHADGRSLRIVMLGDYVGKGAASARCLEILRTFGRMLPEGAVACLAGNHEAEMLDAARDAAAAEAWVANESRGATVLRSYGLPASVGSLARLPTEHVDWLKSLGTSHDDGMRLYVHAGLREGVPIEGQAREDMLGTGPRMAPGEGDFGRYVVHGHTPTDGTPLIRRNRACLDTGCGQGRRLSAAAFGDSERAPTAILSVAADGSAGRVTAGRPSDSA